MCVFLEIRICFDLLCNNYCHVDVHDRCMIVFSIKLVYTVRSSFTLLPPHRCSSFSHDALWAATGQSKRVLPRGSSPRPLSQLQLYWRHWTGHGWCGGYVRMNFELCEMLTYPLNSQLWKCIYKNCKIVVQELYDFDAIYWWWHKNRGKIAHARQVI